jgi:hypothetical protein
MTATTSLDAHPIQLNPENFDNVAGYWVTNDLLLRSACWYATGGGQCSHASRGTVPTARPTRKRR